MKDMSDIMVAVREHQRKLQLLRDQEAQKKQDKIDHLDNFTKSIKNVVWLLLLAKHDGISWCREENFLTKHVGNIG